MKFPPKWRAAVKIVKVIGSCRTFEQLDTAQNMVFAYQMVYGAAATELERAITNRRYALQFGGPR